MDTLRIECAAHACQSLSVMYFVATMPPFPTISSSARTSALRLKLGMVTGLELRYQVFDYPVANTVQCFDDWVEFRSVAPILLYQFGQDLDAAVDAERRVDT